MREEPEIEYKYFRSQHGTKFASSLDEGLARTPVWPARGDGFDTVPTPVPGPNEVLIRIHAADVGPWDGWIREGKGASPEPLPFTLGSDLAGDVVAIGPDTSGMTVGSQVFGVTNSQFLGACAEYAVASAGMLAMKPKSLTYVEAASVPVVAVTGWQALFFGASLEAGQTVVIHGAAGNRERTRFSSLVGLTSVPSRRQGARTSST